MQLATAAAAPARSGWRALLDFYAAGLGQAELRLGAPVGGEELAGFDEIVLAIGATEVLPDIPGIGRALPPRTCSELGGRDLLVVDDGFGWWPCASAVERGVHAGFETITVATPAAAFGATLPPEPRVQLLARLRGAPLTVRPFTALEALDDDGAMLANTMSGRTRARARRHGRRRGERVARDWSALVPATGGVRVIGDALVPRKVAHAIAEGRAAGEAIGRAHRAPALS